MASFDHLPPGIVPFAVEIRAAAALIGIGEGTFRDMVADGRMPEPRPIGSRVLWDTEEVRAAWRAIPKRGQSAKANTWDPRP